ncbi:MAG: hypothetical protein JNM17_37470 [Archangium sp.]|nr:hypothetical protein [Archangium sp.]
MGALIVVLLAATPVENRLESYEAARTALEAKRVELAAQWKKTPKQTRAVARKAVLEYLDQSAFPAWKGTPWEFYGTSTTPGQGTIACGYFVTTVLEQAGFKIERVWLAQQASAVLVNTLAHGTKVEWLHPSDNADAVVQIKKHFKESQLVVIGFDYHVGLLRMEGDEVRFCHSSFIEPASVTCEDPVPSGAFASKLYVVGDVLNDALLDDWLNARAVKNARK